MAGHQHVVEDAVVGRVVLDVHRPARVVGLQDGVVDHQVAAGAAAAVDAVEADARGVVLVEEVVADDRVLDAVAVDPRAAAEAVVVDDVVLDEGEELAYRTTGRFRNRSIDELDRFNFES